MKCQKCGFEFEGIFCPECGTKHIDIAEAERLEREEEEQKRLEKEKLERLAKEKAEQERLVREQERQERLVKEKLEAERLEKEKRELDARNYNGIVYRDENEAMLAREENNIIDSLKQRLMTESTQKKRQEILADFKVDIQTADAKKRLEALRMKVNQKKPKAVLYNWLLALSDIIAIIITVIMGNAGMTESPFFIIVVLWYGIGIPVWIVWKIILVIKKKSPNYYLNIKHI